MKYYIATKLENHKAHNALRDRLNKKGHECTYDWTHHGPVYSHGLQRVEEVAQLEHEGVANADTVIMLWPGGRGTHVELGMGIALGKQCIIISDVDAHHEATTETCAFYHHPHVTMFKTVAEYLRKSK
jgi:nucleoside 2-deoxyribosyltransferase